jgi:hypothetical protein
MMSNTESRSFALNLNNNGDITMNANDNLNLIDIDLSRSSRANFLHQNREIMAGIIKRYAPNSLYRFEDCANTVLIMTSDAVNYKGLASELKVSVKDIQVIDYNAIIDSVLTEKIHTFAICMNSISRTNGKAYKIESKDIENWFKARGESNGFKVVNMSYSVEFRANGKDRTPICMREITGELVITDKAKFEDMLLCGIGRSKAYGCGLMLLDNLAAA